MSLSSMSLTDLPSLSSSPLTILTAVSGFCVLWLAEGTIWAWRGEGCWAPGSSSILQTILLACTPLTVRGLRMHCPLEFHRQASLCFGTQYEHFLVSVLRPSKLIKVSLIPNGNNICLCRVTLYGVLKEEARKDWHQATVLLPQATLCFYFIFQHPPWLLCHCLWSFICLGLWPWLEYEHNMHYGSVNNQHYS